MMPTAASRPENETETHGQLVTEPETKYTRLSVNLSLDTAQVLKNLAKRDSITITDAIRRAIACWSFIEDELAKGNRIAVIEQTDAGERVREVIFVSS
jgi:hypothetical protein